MGHGNGWLGEGVECVSEGTDLDNVLAVVCFEADLAIVGPNAFNPGVGGEGTEVGVIGRGQILIDGVPGADFVRGEVTVMREGCFLVAEDEVACGLVG